MKCLKTGAQVWIQELSGVYPADVYGVGNEALVVRFNPLGRREAFTAEQAGPETHRVYQVEKYGEDWVREDLGVVVCLRENFNGELIE